MHALRRGALSALCAPWALQRSTQLLPAAAEALAAGGRACAWRDASTSAPDGAAAAAWVPDPQAVAQGAVVPYVTPDGEELLLQLSSHARHGYKQVVKHPASYGYFTATRRAGGLSRSGFATALDAAVARARDCKRLGRGAYSTAKTPKQIRPPRLPPFLPSQRDEMDAWWRAHGVQPHLAAALAARGTRESLFRDREELQKRLDVLRSVFPGKPVAALVKSSVNILIRPPEKLPEKLATLSAAVPEVNWRSAFATCPWLVCLTEATLIRNWQNLVDLLGKENARLAILRHPSEVAVSPETARIAAKKLAAMLPGVDWRAVIASQPFLSADLGPASLIPIKMARLREAAAAMPHWAAQISEWSPAALARALTCGPVPWDRLRYLALPDLPFREAVAAARSNVQSEMKATRISFDARFPGFAPWATARAAAAAARLLDASERALAENAPSRRPSTFGKLPSTSATDWLEDFGPGGRPARLRDLSAEQAATS